MKAYVTAMGNLFARDGRLGAVRATFVNFWNARAPRERAIIAALAAVGGIALCLWVLVSADRTRLQLRASVATLRVQAASLERQAAELERLRTAPAAAASKSDLRNLVRSESNAAGLSGALGRLESQDADHIHVSFGAVAFADWLAWVAHLQTQQVRLEACRIEALSTPGLVSVTATLGRAKSQ